MEWTKCIGFLLLCVIGLLEQCQCQRLRLIPGNTDVKQFVNNTYFVSCEVSDGSWEAEWLNPRNRIIDTSVSNRVKVEYGNGVDLFFTRITTQDAGVYTCVSKKSRAKASFNLTVIRPIVFDTSLQEQSAPEGKTYLLQCRARGQNQPKIFWKVDQRKPVAPKFRISAKGLMIHNVTREDAKRSYLCRATDVSSPMPDSKMMNISLKVEFAPRPASGMKREHWGVVGAWANLTCAVEAEPPAQFKWLYRNSQISTNDEYFILNPENKSILQVLVRTESKFGKYTCRAVNKRGKVDSELFLLKGQKPATPKLIEERVGTNAAKIRVTYLRGGRIGDPARDKERDPGKLLPITGYVVQYKMMTRSEWSPANISVYDEGFVIKGLKPSITYQIRAASKNEASVGEFSSALRIVTPKHSSWTYSSSWSFQQSSKPFYSIVVFALNVLLHKILRSVL